MKREVNAVFNTYPAGARKKLKYLRKLILDTALEQGIDQVEETLKWGEPSYLTKTGSTLRVAWKPSDPDGYAIFFNCQTRLLETFRELYPDEFSYDGKRAIRFKIDEPVSDGPLRHCIALSLTYHQVKHLPLLGA
jgi:hypothetical protein